MEKTDEEIGKLIKEFVSLLVHPEYDKAEWIDARLGQMFFELAKAWTYAIDRQIGPE